MRIGFIVAGIAVLALVRAAAADPPALLERPPVCEASAALVVPCTMDAARSCVWIADNERAGEVYQYDLDASGRLTPASRFAISLGDAKVGDIEALVADDEGVLAVGSHSRTSKCKPADSRLALARLVPDPARRAVTAQVVPGASHVRWLDGCPSLFALADAAADGPAARLRDAFCAAHARTERTADDSVNDAQHCPGDAFNIEGALAQHEGGVDRVWLGLRAPLVDGRAVLLRLARRAGGRQAAFDGIATIALGDRGIRELTSSEGRIWGIAGCVRDCPDGKSILWSIPAGELVSGATIDAVDVVPGVALSPSAEGLVVQGERRRAIVVIDGDQGSPACKVPPRQQVVALPAP